MNSNLIRRDEFVAYLRQHEKSPGTIEKYLRDVGFYEAWLLENNIKKPFANASKAKTIALDYKDHLRAEQLVPTTINSKLAAINAYFRFLDINEKVRYLKVQRRIFLDENRELTMNEYKTLVKTARAMGNERIALCMETMASTGMRVSELQYVTVEALRNSTIQVDLKAKIRTIFVPQRLALKLMVFAANSGIESGYVFRTGSGMPVRRKQIWNEMKAVSRKAGILESKVFPHNMRHVFARTYYTQCKDIARLADVLGHSSLETTRVYLMDSGLECQRQINSLGLVC